MVHSIVDKAKVIACLSVPIQSKKRYSKDQKRRLSGGLINEALQNVSQRRGSALVFVNCAYTSQMDSRHGVIVTGGNFTVSTGLC